MNGIITKIISTCYLYGFSIINNKYLFIGGGDNNLKLFDIEKNIFIKDFPKHTNSVIGVKVISDNNNNYLVTYGSDNNINLWRLE